MLTPNELANLPEGIIEIWDEFEESLLINIAERLAKNDMYLTSTAQWRIIKAQQLGLEYDFIVDQLSKTLNKSDKEIAKVIQNASMKAVDRDNVIFQEAFENGLIQSFDSNPSSIMDIIVSGINATNGEIRNFTKSYAGNVNKILEHALDNAFLEVKSGMYSPKEASRNAIKELADKGITSVGTTKNKIEKIQTVVNRAVRTGGNQTALKCAEENFFAMGGELVLVTSHYGARPEHAVWQGKIYAWSRTGKRNTKYPDFVKSTLYGKGEGLGGWNCRHNFYPYFEGISQRNFEPIDLNENERIYKLDQKLNNAKRNAAKYKQQASVLKAGGLDDSKQVQLTKKWNQEAKAIQEVLKDNKKVVNSIKANFIEQSTPGIGKIIYDEQFAKYHQKEIEVANWIIANFGGDIELLKENNTNFTADYLWNNQKWELKEAASKVAIDTRLRKAYKQLDDKIGGVILDVSTSTLSNDDLLEYIKSRMIVRKITTVIVKKFQDIIDILK